MDVKNSDFNDNVCSICHESETLRSIGKCDHHVCYKCSTRMRVLMNQLYCPICRTELDKVVITREKLRFREAVALLPSHVGNQPYGIYFENELARTAFDQLQQHCCPLCEGAVRKTFGDFAKLRGHVSREHQRQYCDICTKHVQHFSSERKTYSREELVTHRKKGDDGDKSHKGHPLCEFCDVRFLDSDELWRHLRKDHYLCHFCDADGKQLYFSAYDNVRHHFAEEHFLCEEGDCLNVQFTNAFRSDIDFRAHKAQYHLKHLSKVEQKQARVLDVPINYGPIRHRNAGGQVAATSRERQHRKGASLVEEESTTLDQIRRQPGGNVRVVANMTSEEDELAVAMKASQQLSEIETSRKSNAEFNAEDFPRLDGASASGSRAQADGNAAVTSAKAPGRGKVDSMAKKFARSNNFSVAEDDAADGRVSGFPALASTGAAIQVAARAPQSRTSVSSGSSAAVKVKANVWNSMDSEFPALGGGAPMRPAIPAASASSGWSKVPKSKPKRPASAAIAAHSPRSSLQPADFPSLPADNGLTSLAQLGKWIETDAAQARHSNPPAQASAAASGVFPSAASAQSTAGATSDPASHKKKSKKKKKTKFSDLKLQNDVESDIQTEVQCNDVVGVLLEEARGGVVSTTVVGASSVEQLSSRQNEQALGDGKIHNQSPLPPAAAHMNVVGAAPPVATMFDIDAFPSLAGKSGALKSGIESSATSSSFAVLSSGRSLPPPGFVPAAVQPTTVRPPPGLVSALTNGVGVNSSSYVNGTHHMPTTTLPAESLADIANFVVTKVTTPPGLTLPPPGMMLQPPQVAKAPPGITSLSLVTTEMSSKALTMSAQFIEPVEFAQRNWRLISAFKKAVDNSQEKVETFRQLSAHFRSGVCSGVDFYCSCQEVMGCEAFVLIFPELLVLLPDIGKQQELLKAHMSSCSQQASMRASVAMNSNWLREAGTINGCAEFVVCDVCHQVLANGDSDYHAKQHGCTESSSKMSPLADDFPSLSAATNGHVLKSWVKKQ